MVARVACICLALLLILQPLPVTTAQSTADPSTSVTPAAQDVHPATPVKLDEAAANAPKPGAPVDASQPAGSAPEQADVHPSKPVVLDDATANTPKQPEQVTSYHFFTLSASAGFIPSNDTITWYYPGTNAGGCIHPTATGAWRGTLNLEDGTKITYLWLGYYNYINSAATTLRLLRYDQRGPETEIANVTSLAGSASFTGYKQAGIPIDPAFVVDNTWYSYVFVWDGATTSSHEELCSAQVGYTSAPIFGTFLPTINR